MQIDDSHLTELWGKVYVSGRLSPAEEASASALDRGLLYGDGLFETVRVYGGKPFMLEEHLRRMAEGASRIALVLPDKEEIKAAVGAVLQANSLTEAYLRITVTRGPTGKMWSDLSGCSPAVLVLAKPFNRPDFGEGLRLTVSRFRIDERGPLCGVKHTGILPKILARTEAVNSGADDAVLLDTRGFVGEGTSSNLFWAKGGRLYTPSLSCGILAGVTRQVVAEIASAEKIAVEEGEFRLDVVKEAEEVFLTSSTWEIAPVRELDGSVFRGSAGPVTTAIHRLYRKRITNWVKTA